MNVCESVEVLMLVHLYVRLLVILLKVRVHHNNLLLQLLVLTSKLVLLTQLFFNGLDEVSLHLILAWKLCNLVGILAVFVFFRFTHFILTVHLVLAVFLRAL